ncbi:MAG: PEP/pyruvate-binding domain-containing protein, partial [Promethearchaeota archaeon]
PDLIILNKIKFDIVKTVIGKKEKLLIADPNGMSTILIETEKTLQEKCSLNRTQLKQLHNLGINLENFFNYPQDIEWAIENNTIYTLQSRPITTLAN